jgi:hypothetical protein
MLKLGVLSIAITYLCPTDANYAIPYTDHKFAFILRGGGSSSSADDTVDNNNIMEGISASNRQQMIGVIDLRPKLGPDSIIFAQDNSRDGVDKDTLSDVIFHRANFPTVHLQDNDEISDNNEEMMDEQAASSNSIGKLCSTVYLIIAYNFDDGKTVLHSSLGGTKLMALVDGVRSRMLQAEANQRIDGESSFNNDNATKLVLVLVPTDENNIVNTINPRVLDLKNIGSDDWDASGAHFLVDRLSEAFALGGEEYQSMDPFAVEMIGAFTQTDDEVEDDNNNSDNEINEVILAHIQSMLRSNDVEAKPKATLSMEEFQNFIRQAYISASGAAEKLSFQ